MIEKKPLTPEQDLWNQLSFEEEVWFYQSWKRAKWSQIRFCTKHHLPLEEFREWCKDMDRVSVDKHESVMPLHSTLQTATDFCEVELMHPEQPANSTMTLELSFPNQIKVRIEAHEQQFAFLLKEMLHATSIVR
jgi:hypothetical protein